MDRRNNRRIQRQQKIKEKKFNRCHLNNTISIDDEYQLKYEEFTGINANSREFKLFSEDEQIERYAKALKFWEHEYITPNSDSDMVTLQKSYFVANARTELTQNIKSKFPIEVQQKIFDRKNSVISEKIKNDIKKELENKYNQAIKLYNICKRELDEDNNIICDPNEWLASQDRYVSSWKKFKNDLLKNDISLGGHLLDTSVGEYMDFMCDSYPMGFGKKIYDATVNDEICDGAEIYYQLIHNG